MPDSLDSRDDLDIGDSFETAVSSVSTSVHNKNKQMPTTDFYQDNSDRRDTKHDYTAQNGKTQVDSNNINMCLGTWKMLNKSILDLFTQV